MRYVNIKEDMFYGTSESELRKIDFLDSYLPFIENARIAYANAEKGANMTNSDKIIVHITSGNFSTIPSAENGESKIKLGDAGREAYKLGLARAYGGGEIRVYKSDGMSGMGYFRTVYLDGI